MVFMKTQQRVIKYGQGIYDAVMMLLMAAKEAIRDV